MKWQGSATKGSSSEGQSSGGIPSELKKLLKKTEKSFLDDFVKESTKTLLNQLSGSEIGLTSGEEISLGQNQKLETQQETPHMTREHMRYFEQLDKPKGTTEQREQAQRAQQIEGVLMEIKKLREEVKEVEHIVKDVDVDKIPQKPGKYDLSVVEFIFVLVREARKKVADVSEYARVFKSRKSEKSYHSMAKKHGTSFSMHHDRAVATQSG